MNVGSGTFLDRFRPWLQDGHCRLIIKSFLLFLWTGLLVALLFAAIRWFDDLGNFSPHKKQAFQGITGALVLLIGLSVFVSDRCVRYG